MGHLRGLLSGPVADAVSGRSHPRRCHLSLQRPRRKEKKEKKKNLRIFERIADGKGIGCEAGRRGRVVCVTVARRVDSFQGSPGNSCLQGRGLMSSWGDTVWGPLWELLFFFFCLGNEEDPK